MLLLELLELFNKHQDIYEVQIPDLSQYPPSFYYTVRIVKYTPNKESPKSIKTFARRYLHRNPRLSNEEIKNIELKFSIKIKDL